MGRFDELLYIAGIGSGKSFYSSKAIQFILHRLLCLKDPQEFYNKASGTKIAFINISTSLAQAKDIVFGEIKNRIDHSPWFMENYPPDSRIKSVLRFPKNLYVLPVGSNEEAPLGYTIFGGVIDEASFHKMTKDKDYAEESYHQMKKRIASRFLKNGVRHGKLIIITSPRYVNDFAERKFREDMSPGILKRRVPLWDAMPQDTFCGEKFDIGKYLSEFKGTMCPIEYERDFIQNAERAMRDFGAQASLAIEAFFRNHAIITEKANKDRLHPWDKNEKKFHEWFWNSKSRPNYDANQYHVHCDLGLNRDGKGDFCGIAAGRFDGWEEYEKIDGTKEKRPRIKIAYMERINAGPKSEILFSDVRDRIYQLRDIGYDIGTVTFDGWQCSIGSNEVELLSGGKIRIDEIKKQTWIYGYDTEKNCIVPALCNPVIKTGEKSPVYMITLDNGEKVGFTPEHKILMRDGTYKMVSELKSGDSLMPLYFRNRMLWKSEYKQVLQVTKKTKRWEFVHRTVAVDLQRCPNKNEVIHHKDFNRFNNSPENLVIMDSKKHAHMHVELAKKNGPQVSAALKGVKKTALHNKCVSYGMKLYHKNASQKTKDSVSKKISSTLKKKWLNDKEYKENMLKRPVYYGESSPRYNKLISNDQVMFMCDKYDTLKQVCDMLRVNKEFIYRRLKMCGYHGFYAYKNRNNHKVVSVDFYGYEDVYDIEVPRTHNFGLAAGIFVHNSIDSVQTLRQAGFRAEFFSVDRNPQSYHTLKSALLEGRLDYYNYPPFIEELEQLEELRGNKIDHPRLGHKDVSDAVAAVCYHAAKGRPGLGILIPK